MIYESRLFGENMQLHLGFESQACAEFMRRVKPQIDRIITSLTHAKFRSDPLFGARDSRVQSFRGSAQKREGDVIEIALREALKENKDFQVWSEQNFAISSAADLVASQCAEDSRESELPYGEEFRKIQIDVIVYCLSARWIAAYESKRGNGRNDSGSIRQKRRDLLCTRSLLKSYGQAHGCYARNADARIIYYLGCCSLPPPFSLVGGELDEHFNFPIQTLIETVLAYYRDRTRELRSLMESRDDG